VKIVIDVAAKDGSTSKSMDARLFSGESGNRETMIT
jgi:hypothetical protein